VSLGRIADVRFPRPSNKQEKEKLAMAKKAKKPAKKAPKKAK